MLRDGWENLTGVHQLVQEIIDLSGFLSGSGYLFFGDFALIEHV